MQRFIVYVDGHVPRAIDAEDAQDAAMTWGRGQTLEWWRERGDVAVGVRHLPSGDAAGSFLVNVGYDLDVQRAP